MQLTTCYKQSEKKLRKRRKSGDLDTLIFEYLLLFKFKCHTVSCALNSVIFAGNPNLTPAHSFKIEDNESMYACILMLLRVEFSSSIGGLSQLQSATMLTKSRDQKRKSLFLPNYKYSPNLAHILDVYAGERSIFIQLTNG